MPIGVPVDKTRRDIRHTFLKWDIDHSEFEILWEEDLGRGRRGPGVRVRYLRNGIWQEVACFGFPNRPENLRQCFLLLDRLRIAERFGVQYAGLTFTKEITAVDKEQTKREDLLEAYDFLGVSPDDPIELVKDVFQKKCHFYHPDKGGSAEKFKRLNNAYERICESRGAKP